MPLLAALEHLAAVRELGAFALPDADVFEILLELCLIDNRADVRSGRKRVIDLELAEAFRQRRYKAIVYACGNDEPRRCGAALAGGKIRAVHGAIHRDR